MIVWVKKFVFAKCLWYVVICTIRVVHIWAVWANSTRYALFLSFCVHLSQQGEGLATQTGTKLHDDDAVQLKISLEM